ncbi:SAM hydrolase/SAM-dependent halogenase family protein [Argonema antarcticum]|uniref:SAM hydrolase/SAM-dependent halogenase family protein n=1 Tax=Argonema antarcticum TaxID=2942763 RepID=UPI00201369FE|nr:SAM-dependent chlorinase/fluorinase [Argonema antarcticum]MCL1475387.1 S-adenosyl-l-methionine hydroxide adenosyltransferase family protein [Argonema antarcticum A004/B2]
MLNNRLLTLLSDFGLSDIYVGVMKGVIAQINPTLTAIDLTHEIGPQNIAAARFCLMSAYPYFPDGTVHIAVVDPGVGSKRRGVAIKFDGGFLVGPDNGLFSGVLRESPPVAAVELTNSEYWRTPTPSTTFHGRDIFAAVGAHLASGVPLEQLGRAIDPETLVQLPILECKQTDAGFIGYIQYVDRFGNLITNIPGNLVEGKTWSVEADGFTILGNKTYSDSPAGSFVALVGSHGWVEIAVNNGNAKLGLHKDLGDSVQILLHS